MLISELVRLLAANEKYFCGAAGEEKPTTPLADLSLEIGWKLEAEVEWIIPEEGSGDGDGPGVAESAGDGDSDEIG